MPRGKLKAGELSIRAMEDLYSGGDEALRGFIIKKAEEQGIRQEVFLERIGKTKSPLGNKVKVLHAYGDLETILNSPEMQKVFEALPEFRITFDTKSKSYEVHQVRGKHDKSDRED